jgi:PAS domain S-box-containing protein
MTSIEQLAVNNNALQERIKELEHLQQAYTGFTHEDKSLVSIYRLLADSIPQLVWITRGDGYHEYFNQRWYDYTGTTLEQTRGEGWSLFLHPDDYERTIEVWTNSLQTGALYEIEYRFKEASTGNYRWFLGRAMPVCDAHGNVVKWFGTCTDIHDQKQAENNLRLLTEVSTVLAGSLEYVQTLEQVAALCVTHIPNLDFCTVDLLDETEQIIERVAAASSDPTSALLIGQPDYNYPVTADDRHPVARVLATGQPYIEADISDEIRQYSEDIVPDGFYSFRDLNLRCMVAMPFTVRGKTIGVLALSSNQASQCFDNDDVQLVGEIARRVASAVDNARLYASTQKNLETQKELDTLKDLFVSIASHELRTPLTAIRGYSQMLQKGVQAQPVNAEKLERYADSILQQTSRMNNMIAQLLDFSRLQNRNFELHYGDETDLAELVGRVVEQHRMLTKSHTFRLCLGEKPLMATVDEERLEQVLNNLVSNAAKYSPNGTNVVVTLERAANRDEALIAVKDEGFGISAEHQAHIFERFYRAKTEDTSSVKGLGLGLYITHEIVNAHGGQMWIESEPGKGSTFYVAVPLKRLTIDD